MAAVTAEQIKSFKNYSGLVKFPVANGETIYSQAFACIDNTGYLVNLATTTVAEARVIAIPYDKSANVTGPAATSAAGSIEGTSGLEKGSAVSGDKTVRDCVVDGLVLCTFSSIAQSDVGKVVYAANNNDLDESANAGVPVGTLVAYLSSTSGWVALNTFYMDDGVRFYKGALTATTGTTGGGAFSWANPMAETIMITHCILDISTAATGAANVDVGVAANGTTSSDTLLDGQDVGTAAVVLSSLVNNGTNGGVDKATSTEYVTATASATLAGMVGTIGIFYRIWE